MNIEPLAELLESMDRANLTAPTSFPRLFESPSVLPKLTKALATIKHLSIEKQQERETYTLCLREDGEYVELFDQDVLDSEIKRLEADAWVMRKSLVERMYLVVGSVNEMKAVNELRLGVGAGSSPDMGRFRGEIYVPGNLSRDMVKAIVSVERSRQTF